MTGIELLRKYADGMPTKGGCSQLFDAFDKECDDFGSCGDCHRFVCNAIADQIEREAERTCELTKDVQQVRHRGTGVPGDLLPVLRGEGGEVMTGIEKLRLCERQLRADLHELYINNIWDINVVPLYEEIKECLCAIDTIADQIEREAERTCRDKNGGQRSMGFECTRCETQCEHIYNMCTGEIDLPTYCPGCGARVVME